MFAGEAATLSSVDVADWMEVPRRRRTGGLCPLSGDEPVDFCEVNCQHYERGSMDASRRGMISELSYDVTTVVTVERVAAWHGGRVSCVSRLFS